MAPAVMNIGSHDSITVRPNRAHDDGPPRELAHAIAAPAIDLRVPLALDLFGRTAEALDG